MRLIALRDLSGKIQTIQKGAIFTLPKDKALPLIEAGLITPAERAAYRIYSEIFQAHLWIVETDHDMHSLRGQGVTEAIYTANEIAELKKMPKEALKAIHNVKTVFEKSQIKDVFS